MKTQRIVIFVAVIASAITAGYIWLDGPENKNASIATVDVGNLPDTASADISDIPENKVEAEDRTVRVPVGSKAEHDEVKLASTENDVPSDVIARRQAIAQLLERDRKRRDDTEKRNKSEKDKKEKELEELLRSIFGKIPVNPIAQLLNLDEDELESLIRGGIVGSDAGKLGDLLSENTDTETLMRWFDGAEMKGGSYLSALTQVFSSAMINQSLKIEKSPTHSDRAVMFIRRVLEQSKKDDYVSREVISVLVTIRGLCPSPAALDLIRHFTLKVPHGNEIVETALSVLLRNWPLNDVSELIIEQLKTRRAGPIKGFIREWGTTIKTSILSKWTLSGLKQTLEQPLADAVMETDSRSAVYYARIFAAESMLKPRALEIGKALLNRNDNVISAQGFFFLRVVDQQLAENTWNSWFNSSDENKVRTACLAAVDLPEVSSSSNSLKRLFGLASDITNSTRLQTVAGEAFCQLDLNYDRSLIVLKNWLNDPTLKGGRLAVAGKIVTWGPQEKVEAVLFELVDDSFKQPQALHYPMFLLATSNPSRALNMCLDEKNKSRFTEQTKLLVAATAEAMKPQELYSKARELRDSCAESEPDWVIRIRKRTTGTTRTTEERVVAQARLSRSAHGK